MPVQMKAAQYGGPDQIQAYHDDVPQAGPGQVTIEVRAVGVNPTDYKGIGGYRGRDESALPLPLGYEAAGVISAIGADTEIASGGGAVGDAVMTFRVTGAYADLITVPAKDVFAKPDALDFPSAANLFLVGSTAADMLRVVPAESGQTVVIHGGSSAVGVSLLQQLALIGVRAIGTASERNFDAVRRFGGEPTTYGEGLEQRLRDLAPDGFDAAYDCVGTDEAVDVSLALVPKDRLVTIAGFQRAQQDGFAAVGGGDAASGAFRDEVRAHLVQLAAEGKLVVPVAKTYPLAQSTEALQDLADQHPGGKFALIP